MRLRPDDDLHRVHAVWLGPRGWTFPWAARYVAYATFLAVFLLILLFEAVTPLSVGVPPLWEFSIAVLVTYGAMSAVDHDRPLRTVVETALLEARAPRAAGATRPSRVHPARVRTRSPRCR